MESAYTLYWVNGNRTIITGKSFEEAFKDKYREGTMYALDFYIEGQDFTFYFDTEERRWRWRR